MASSWGASWGSSWANSWGATSGGGTPTNSGALARNKPARDYEYHGTLSPSKTLTDFTSALSCAFTMTVTWGNAYSAGVHGWQVILHEWTDVTTGTAHYETFFVTPWGTITGPAGTGFPSLAFKVYVHGTTLTGGCNDWALPGVDYDFYVQVGGGALTLIGTVHGTDLSGTGYDHRLNICQIAAGSSINPEPAAVAACSVHYAAQPSGTWRVDATGTGGFRYSADAGVTWTIPAGTCDSTLTPPTPTTQPGCPDCSCSETLAPVSMTDCYTGSVASTTLKTLSATLISADCTFNCPDGETTVIQGHEELWTSEMNYVTKSSAINMIPGDSGIAPTLRHREAVCGCTDPPDSSPPTIIETTTSENPTISESFQPVTRKYAKKCCHYIISPASCGPIGGG